MSTTRIVVLAAAALVLAATCTALALRRTTVGEIDRLLSKHVPVGSPHQRVTAVLDSLGVEHSSYDASVREIRAIWRRTSVDLFQHTSIEARFLFDEAGQLVRYELMESITAT